MPRPLKERLKYKEAIDGIRSIWNKFDPIGVADEVDDEYNSYLTPTLDLLVQGASINDISEYYKNVVFGMMALEDYKIEKINKFGIEMKAWWDTSLDELTCDDSFKAINLSGEEVEVELALKGFEKR